MPEVAEGRPGEPERFDVRRLHFKRPWDGDDAPPHVKPPSERRFGVKDGLIESMNAAISAVGSMAVFIDSMSASSRSELSYCESIVSRQLSTARPRFDNSYSDVVGDERGGFIYIDGDVVAPCWWGAFADGRRDFDTHQVGDTRSEHG